MKKFKNYILMLLIPLILLGCVKKGVSDAVTEDNTTISADSNMAALINSNRNRITTLLNDNIYLQESYLTTANNYLYNIYQAYSNGGELSSAVAGYYSNAESNKDTFFTLNSMLNYDEISLTYNKMLSQQSNYSSDTNFSNALALIESKYKAIKNEKTSNTYYLEVYESDLLNKDLDELTSTSITYKQYLKNLGFLYDESLADVYGNLAKMVLRDINVLNSTTDFSSLSTTNPYNDLYRLRSGSGTKVVLSDANRAKLLTALNTLYSMYSNYESYSVTQILAQESAFQAIDRAVFSDLSENGLKYYLVTNTASSGNKLSINVAVYNGLSTDLITKLETIYTTKTLSTSEKNELSILITNLKQLKSKIEYYYLINPTDVYSSTVVSAQFYQIILDELEFITSMLTRS